MKNSRKFSIVFALLLTLSAFALPSCSKKPADVLVGKWSVGAATVEFRKDGTLTSMENSHIATGTFKFIDRTHMDLEMIEGGANHLIPCEVVVNGDQASITMTVPDGPSKGEKYSVQLKRIK
ncbi:MAG TPA: hypothetical protein VN873_03715 [Candidatus Angelobacter sp.]|nr:hypothetical protein [Candidatus Angelobacter sp.]